MNLEEQSRKIIGQYRKRKWIGIGILVIGMIYAFYLLLGVLDERAEILFGGLPSLLLWLSVYISFFLIAVIAFFIRWTGFVIINKVHSEQCDPFLYEACIEKLRSGLFPDRLLCNRAIAQYHQGNYERSYETLRKIRCQKLKGEFLVSYYILLSMLYFHQGRGQEVTELENRYRAALKNRKQDKLRCDRFCTGNNLVRAVKNKDYEAAFGFLSHQRILQAKTGSAKINKVTDSMWEARIFLGMGETQAARLQLQFVTSQGGRMAIAEEAGRLLKEMSRE